MAFSPDGVSLATADAAKEVLVWSRRYERTHTQSIGCSTSLMGQELVG